MPVRARARSAPFFPASYRCVAYINDMKEMFKKLPLTIKKALTPKQKVQKLMTDIGG